MIVRVSGWVFEKTSLQGIPWVSAWVGAHRWSRVVAYWLFPPAFLGVRGACYACICSGPGVFGRMAGI